ncbi:MAG: UDP-N-acetylmuramate dehydrogenase [Actinobacteria bacterium]|nr:UDP-N-acetylmuramate dehydrogenase [Actinomycetota bacterium]
MSPDPWEQLRAIHHLKLWPRAPLAPFTTIGVGGAADLLVAAATPEAVAAALACLVASEHPWTFLGAGSNLLASDRGYRGVVLKLADEMQFIGAPSVFTEPGTTEHARSPLPGDDVVLEVGAATLLPRLAALVADWGLSGLEFACAIPGSVGGAVLMNAGAHGGDMCGVVDAVQMASAGGVQWFPAASLSWAYRSCAIPADHAVTAVRLRLTQSERQTVRALQRRHLQWRRENQPRGVRTFGSTFRNPAGDSAGRLLDAAGMKGAGRGGAVVSRIHANFVVNSGDATGEDVMALMTMMREAVYVRSGVLLEPEVRVLGMKLPWERP